MLLASKRFAVVSVIGGLLISLVVVASLFSYDVLTEENYEGSSSHIVSHTTSTESLPLNQQSQARQATPSLVGVLKSNVFIATAVIFVISLAAASAAIYYLATRYSEQGSQLDELQKKRDEEAMAAAKAAEEEPIKVQVKTDNQIGPQYRPWIFIALSIINVTVNSYGGSKNWLVRAAVAFWFVMYAVSMVVLFYISHNSTAVGLLLILVMFIVSGTASWYNQVAQSLAKTTSFKVTLPPPINMDIYNDSLEAVRNHTQSIGLSRIGGLFFYMVHKLTLGGALIDYFWGFAFLAFVASLLVGICPSF